MKYTFGILVGLSLMILSLVLGGCSDKESTGPTQSSEVNFSVTLEKTALAERINTVRLSVFQNEQLIEQASTELIDGQFTFSPVTLPVGTYSFQLEGFNSGGEGEPQILYSGQSTVNLGAGSTGVTIYLEPAVPMVRVAPYIRSTTRLSTFTSKLELWNIDRFSGGEIKLKFDTSQLQFMTAGAANDDWGGIEVEVVRGENEVTLNILRSSESDATPLEHALLDLNFEALLPGDEEIIPEILGIRNESGPLTYAIYEETQLVNVIDQSQTGTLSGRVIDAVDGDTLAGATVVLTGPQSRQTTTDVNGRFSFTELIYGEYQIAVSLQGYVTLERTVTHDSPVTDEVFAVTVQPQEGQYRVVLTWGETPSDLDAHMWTTISEILYEVYYGDKGAEAEPPYIALDIDDVSGFGPETITIYDLVGPVVFGVYNYSGTPSITGSNAKIEVYSSAGKIAEFSVPTTGDGLWWHVFNMNVNGQITTVDTLSNNDPVAQVKRVQPAKAAN